MMEIERFSALFSQKEKKYVQTVYHGTGREDPAD